MKREQNTYYLIQVLILIFCWLELIRYTWGYGPFAAVNLTLEVSTWCTPSTSVKMGGETEVRGAKKKFAKAQ